MRNINDAVFDLMAHTDCDTMKFLGAIEGILGVAFDVGNILGIYFAENADVNLIYVKDVFNSYLFILDGSNIAMI